MTYYIFRGVTRHKERYMVLKKVTEEKDIKTLIKNERYTKSHSPQLSINHKITKGAN